MESQSTLEAERSELEGLRHDANGDATSALADDLKRVHKELVSTKATLEKTQREATQHADLVAELRQDLRSAEREIDRLQKLSPRPETNRRTSVASSRSSLGGDDAAATREQIVGLKSIIETLTAENKDLAEQNSKVVAEAKQLKDAQQALERTVEKCVSLPVSSARAICFARASRRAERVDSRHADAFAPSAASCRSSTILPPPRKKRLPSRPRPPPTLPSDAS